MARIFDVTPREFDVVRELAADGADNYDIADRLGVSTNTVHAHVKAALAKSGCLSRTELAVKVARGVITPRPVSRCGWRRKP